MLFIKVHLLNVLPYFIRQEVTHILSFGNAPADEARGDLNKRGLGEMNMRVVVEGAGGSIRPGINV